MSMHLDVAPYSAPHKSERMLSAPVKVDPSRLDIAAQPTS